MSFESLPIVLAAGLHTFHPELTFEDVVEMLDWDTVFAIRDEVVTAWVASFPKRDKKENPPEPVQS